mmetsp:Transcript_33021/g.80244  ORF Transcript_33021/g.80244 Transcript_33021/m.80244 type:complete len:389 (-) Transcript_33021:527-1693(-)
MSMPSPLARGHSPGGESKMDILVRLAEPSLFLVSFPRKHLRSYTDLILRLMLFPPRDASFFTYTETSDDGISLFVDKARIKCIREGMEGMPAEMHATICQTSWACLQISHGSQGGCSTSDLVAHVSQCLAEGGISIFYTSTLNTDYVMVSNPSVRRALRTLKKRFNLIVDYDGHSTPRSPARTPVGTPKKASNIPAKGNFLQTMDSFAVEEEEKMPKGKPVSKVSLEVLSQSLFLVSIDKRYLEILAKPLIGEFFRFPQGGKGQRLEPDSKDEISTPAQPRFFSYTDADDEISLILNAEAYARIQSYQTKYRMTLQAESIEWKAIRVDGDWGFDEVGLVAAISTALHESGIDLFYLSTFVRDFVLVPASSQKKAEDELKKRGQVFSLR